jgi:hypothetical protein
MQIPAVQAALDLDDAVPRVALKQPAGDPGAGSTPQVGESGTTTVGL